MDFVLGVVLPALVMYVMAVVGMELTPADFNRARRQPGAIALALALQAVVLPLLAIAMARALLLPPTLACSIVIISAAPIAALSNYYALIARAEVALAVTLTAVSSMAAVATMPIAVLLASKSLGPGAAGFEPAIAKLAVQTVIGLLLPILVGMTIRRFLPDVVERRRGLLQVLALAALTAIIAFVLIDQIEGVRRHWTILLASALCYTGAALVMGFLASRFIAADRRSRIALMFGFPARNVAIAMLVAVAMQGTTDVAVFGAVYFLAQAVLLVPLARLIASGRVGFAT
jgi:bile acid:Na+ symporter, BASS family